MYFQKIRYLFKLCAVGLVTLLSMVRLTHAETRITNGDIFAGTTDIIYWTEADSPYIIEDPVMVTSGQTLGIDPGAVVVASSTLKGRSAFEVNGGTLNMVGASDKHVTVTGFGGISASEWGKVIASYSDISLEDGLGIDWATASLSSSTISDASTGILGRYAVISLNNSRIYNNRYGVYILPSNYYGPFKVTDLNSMSATGGIGNAGLAMITMLPHSTTISNSSFVQNTEAAIENNDPDYYVQATNNWWGSSAGPSMWSANKITGLINYAPWLTTDPFPVETKCCSSILFIPGLKGTRLYRDEKMPLLGLNTINQLWEPNRNADVTKLYLNGAGSSTDASIYSGKPIDAALGLFDVYGGFMNYLNDLRSKGTVNEWKAFGYDWRKPIAEVVAGNEKKSTTTESLIQTVEDLATRSRTGKVTLIAHSNGGLIAKYLVKALTDIGKSNLIDSVISVAVPYLGTPEAIGDLLHGDNQSILGGYVLRESAARGLGVNMSSVYSLLPSSEYFAHVFGPTIAFASTTIPGVNNRAYSQNINTFGEQSTFIDNSNKGRSNASSNDLSLPILGNSNLLASAAALHNVLDIWSWPATVAHWAIVGWNKATTKSIIYGNETVCNRSGCSSSVVHTATTTIMGDGTVVAPSAAHNAGKAVSLDLEDISKRENRGISHSNILGASSTLATINDIVTKAPTKDEKETLDRISKIPGVTIGEPDYNKEPVSLVLSTHSPVDLHVYDSMGRHTGSIPKPASLVDVEDGLYRFYDEKIPGSTFKQYADGNTGNFDSYIYLPDHDGEKYSVVVDGTGFGEFTYTISN